MSDRAAISALVLTAMGDAWTDSEEYSALPGVVADLLLTSDWLAAEKAKWQAEAWDEGYAASDYEAYHLGTHGRTDNPYHEGSTSL
jgi:hypothetical protein